jgi:IS30 family transposase
MSFFTEVGDKQSRNMAIRSAHMKHGYTLAEIGRHLDLHHTTISKAARDGPASKKR